MAEEDVKYIDSVEVIKDNAIFQQDKAMIHQMMDWAWSHPRNITKVKNNCIAMVTMDLEVASECTYSLPKGNGIVGPSIVLAKLIARQMGNMRCEQRVVSIEEKQVISSAMCFDMETNFAVKTEVRRSIWSPKKGRYTDDMITLTGAAGASIAFRNAVFSVIDPSLVKVIHNAAKKKVTGDLSTEEKLIGKRTTVVNGFKTLYQSYGLTDEEISRSVKKKLIEHITADDIIVLIGYENSLKTGISSFDEIFRPTIFETKPVPPADKSEERLKVMILAAKTRKDLEKIKSEVKSVEMSLIFDVAWKELK